MGAQAVTIITKLAATVVLARLLPAEDFGIIAMILAITGFIALFRDMGLSAASIYRNDLSHAQINGLFWLNAGTGLILTGIVAAAAPVVAWFYERPELTQVTLALSSTFVVSSLGAQHAALMQRDLKFKPKALADVAGAIINFLAAAILALMGYRYWSLAWGIILGALTTTLLYFLFSSFRPSLPRKVEGLRQVIGFGANVTLYECINYVHRNMDNVLIGKVWGASSLGLYSRAYQIMMLPINSLRTPLNSVAFPVLSKLRDDPPSYKQYYCRITAILGFVSIPLMAFLTANASTVVTVALGARWGEVSPIFSWLGLAGLVQPVASLSGIVLLSTGRTRIYILWGLLNTLVTTTGFAVGVQWGAVGVAAAYAISNYLVLYPSLLLAFRGTTIRPKNFFGAVLRPAVASGCAVLIMAAVPSLPIPDVAALAASAGLFFCLYLIIFPLLPGGRAELLSYLRLAESLRG